MREMVDKKKVKDNMQKENLILIKKRKNRMIRIRIMWNKEKKVMEKMTTWRMNLRGKSSRNLKGTIRMRMRMIRRIIIIDRMEELQWKSNIMRNIAMQEIK